VPTVIHEQNAVLGRVNRVFAAKADIVASGFEILQKCPERANHICTGNPLRRQIIDSIPARYTAPKKTINLLIVGGSLGARIVSETMPAAIALLNPELRGRLRVVQQTRAENLEAAKALYKEAGVDALCDVFFDNIEQHLAKSHLVVARAGASSVSEIAVMGKPALFVPLAIAMDDHQTVNAATLKRHGAADILPESEFTPEAVKTTLEERLNDSTWLKSAAAAARTLGRPEAATQLAELVISAAGQ